MDARDGWMKFDPVGLTTVRQANVGYHPFTMYYKILAYLSSISNARDDWKTQAISSYDNFFPGSLCAFEIARL